MDVSPNGPNMFSRQRTASEAVASSWLDAPPENGKAASSSSAAPQAQSGLAPLLLHFDVNKTVIQSDSIQTKTIEEGIREGIAELFWGTTQKNGDRVLWEWARGKPSCNPPADAGNPADLVNYAQYCKMILKDKEERKQAVKSFRFCTNDEARQEMDKLLQVTLKNMQLPDDVRFTEMAQAAGLKGATYLMFPTIFHLVASLQQSRRQFAVLFRSFGADHDQIAIEWNAFCEMKHPVFSKLLQGIGRLDGTVPGIPDRRIHHDGLHTIYRDAEGPLLLLGCFTNGPAEGSWDAWAKQKPKPKADTRGGRDYIRDTLKAETAEGFNAVQKWMGQHLREQRTAAIKDDWAWWQWNGETAEAGKLLCQIGGADTRQLFFDDNIETTDARIVDCRDINGRVMSAESCINRLCTKVNPVEAILDKEYFLRKVQACLGEHMDIGNSLIDFQRQLTEIEELKASLERQVKDMSLQLNNLTEENRRMKLKNRVGIRDEAHLREVLLAHELDLESFGPKDGHRSVFELYKELERGQCWLEQDQDDQGHSCLLRVFEMVFVKVRYKDLILIESHEQDSESRIQSRNYLPGIRKTLKELSFADSLDRWFQTGLGVDLKNSGCVRCEALPVFSPDAPSQETKATQAFPVSCKLQQSEALYVIPEMALVTHRELLRKIGLPEGKHFTTSEKDLSGSTVTRFWRWDKMVTFEATLTQKNNAVVSQVDMNQMCEQLFHKHPRREVYENLLLQMFETFTAKKLCGGFSGSLVIRVQTFESDGRPGEPCIVKMDTREAIEAEWRYSLNVCEALPDRAARIIGDPVYSTDKGDGVEFGAMRLELAGACWNVPELAQGSANLLSTFKDLLLFESEQVLLGRTATAAQDARPFGNVNSVLAETFGPGGVVASLRRKGGSGLRRETEKSIVRWYTLKGKLKTKFNLYTADEVQYPPGKAMRRMYKAYFGEELPNLMELVDGTIKPQLEALAQAGHKELLPLVGLAHGDLNAANIMIDALDAVWLIDFATSVDLPLFTDMCKFEMACLFEYATIPITPELLLDFASDREDMWAFLNVGDWLRIDQSVADELLRALCQRRRDKSLHLMTEEELHGLIATVAARSDDNKKVVRALQSRLTANSKDTEGAFSFCRAASKALLSGDYVFDTLNMKTPPAEGSASGASSVRFFMEHITGVRRFMSRDILSTLREFSPGMDGSSSSLEPCDASSMQLMLPFLRESYRIVGYRDIAPQHKVWSIYHCHVVAQEVLRILSGLNEAIASNSLCNLPIMNQLSCEGHAKKVERSDTGPKEERVVKSQFTEADSIWAHAHKEMFLQCEIRGRMVRRAHTSCPVYSREPGLFAPILRVTQDVGDEERALTLGFKGGEDGEEMPAGPWTLHVVVGEDVDPTQREDGGLLDSRLVDGCIGTAAPGSGEEPASVILNSRLFYMTTALMKSKMLMIKANLHGSPDTGASPARRRSKEQDGVAPVQSLALSSSVLTPHRSPDRKKSLDRQLQKERQEVQFGMERAENFQRSLVLQVVARDSSGEEKMRCMLHVGVATTCYPAGTSLCLDLPEGSRHDEALPSAEVIILKDDGNGLYKVRAADAEPTEESEYLFEPSACNHIFLTPITYKEKQRILVFCEDSGSWADAEVIEVAKEGASFRHRVLIQSAQEQPTQDWMMDTVSAEPPERINPAEGSTKALRYLSQMNSGPSLLSARAYEEEVHKIRLYLRARCSFIIDALSGQRLPVQSCAMPTLHIHRSMFEGSGGGEEEAMQGKKGSGNMSGVGSTASVAQVVSARDLREAGGSTPGRHKNVPRSMSRKASIGSQSGFDDPKVGTGYSDMRQGWQLIQANVDRYQKAVPSCMPNSFLIVGPPGSGKTALTARLVMDCLNRHRDLVPVLLPVADIVKRGSADEMSNQEACDMDSAGIQVWFDKYLRLIYGEDSMRYMMVRQAMSMRRVIIFFDGLEDGGPMMHVVEGLIRDIVMKRHLVVVTTRPLLQKQLQCSLDDLSTHITVLSLNSLTDQQIRSVATARLGLDGLLRFDEVLGALRQGSGPKESAPEDTEEGEKDDDVFGNPMMLSMLICYCTLEPSGDKDKPDKKAREDSGVEGEKADNVTRTAVYRVATDVMLQRVQSKQQVDRHKKDINVGKCKRVLEFMAMTMMMQAPGSMAIGAEDFEALLPEDMSEGWAILKNAVEAGYAMFLRTQRDSGKLEYAFLARVFQNFFAASDIASEGGALLDPLVTLSTLLTKPCWAQILEMLAEAWPLTYVRLIESRLEDFQAADNNTFLHVAAKHGHRPVFQLLKMFTEQNKSARFVKNSDGQTPLHLAAEKGHTKICELLVQLKADMDAEDSAGRLALHVAMQNGKFHTAGYLLDCSTIVKQGSRPRGLALKDRGRTHPAESLARRVLGLPGSEGESLGELSEEDFIKAASDTFVELGFFREKDKQDMESRNREMAALLSVYWICGNHYDSFVQAQKSDKRLTRQSWESIQRWTKETRFTEDPSTVVAMLVTLAIFNLGKIKPFREAFAPEIPDEHNEVLRSVLMNKPSLVPSVSKLDDHLRELILRSTVDFNFGQFIQAENVPASIVPVKDMISTEEHKALILGFFLWQTFARMCGVLGNVRLNGSLFMTEPLWNNIELGVNVLTYLTSESPQEVYDRFLAKRAVQQGLPFDAEDSESRALVRLACLCRTYDAKAGGEVREAFGELEAEERKELSMYLNADGIHRKAILLYRGPMVLDQCRQAHSVGLVAAMRMLLRVYKMADEKFTSGDSVNVVTVMMDEVVELVKACTLEVSELVDDDSNYEEEVERHKERLAEKFEFTQLEINRTGSESQGAVHLMPWQLVTDPDKLDGLASGAAELLHDMDPSASGGIREPSFLKRLSVVFPELGFFNRVDEEDIHKQTRCALLAVYFAWSDQMDAFSRGQAVDKKISEKSWAEIQKWMEMISDDHDVAVEKDLVNVVLVAVLVLGVAKIPKFQSQLAPGAKNHRQTVKTVLDKCPKVLPSYMRLEPKQRALLRKCLTCEFDFEQFLLAENLPASLTAVSAMLQESECAQDEDAGALLMVFVFVIFALMSGSEGERSQEGSVYMTEERFLKFNAGVKALMLLGSGVGEQAVYDRLLKARAEALEMDLDKHRAIVRLACLAQVSNVLDLVPVTDAFKALDGREQEALTRYLDADGVKEKPGFVMRDASVFLEVAMANAEVSLIDAIKIILKVYEEAWKEYHWSDKPLVTVNLGKLAHFAREFFGSARFQDVPFELHMDEAGSEAVVIPKVWIPISSTAELNKLTQQSTQLAREVLQHQIKEDAFKARVGRVFPELTYFSSASSKQEDQTWGALLSVYWLLDGQYEAFIRGQQQDPLSKQSWAWIQEWITKTVKLSTEEAVDATLVFMAIHALGKIREFREERAPDYDKHMHDVALARILEASPEVVPSFSRLSRKYQRLIVDSLSVDFQFSHFLQAETTPANLVVVQEKLRPHGADGFAFFCFRIFAQMCGKLGLHNGQGSLFMNDRQFQRFRPGLDALQQLLGTRDVSETYDEFLLQRSSKAMSRFASEEQRALARLLCLGNAYDWEGGHSICDAFDALTKEEREDLTRWLNRDGIDSTPGYSLVGAPALLQSAKANRAVGLPAALRMLIRVQEECSRQASLNGSALKVVVHLEHLAAWSKDVLPDDFQEAEIVLEPDDGHSQGETMVITVGVPRRRKTATTPGFSAEPSEFAQTPFTIPMDEEPLDDHDELAHPSQARSVSAALAATSLALLLLALLLQGMLGSEGWAREVEAGMLTTAMVMALAVAACLYYSYQDNRREMQPHDRDEAVGLHVPFIMDPWNMTPRRRRQDGHDYMPLQQLDDAT